MAQLLAYLFTITLSHLAMLLRWLGINQPQETWPPDIEANSALNEHASMDLAAYNPLLESCTSMYLRIRIFASAAKQILAFARVLIT